MATGRKNGLTIEVYGSRGSLSFDLERLNELQVDSTATASSRVLVTEADHPYVGAWWPPGHVLGWDHTFISQAADFLDRHRGGRGAVAVVRRRARRPAGAGARSRQSAAASGRHASTDRDEEEH